MAGYGHEYGTGRVPLPAGCDERVLRPLVRHGPCTTLPDPPIPAPRRDFLESLDDGSFFGQAPGVNPSLMSPTPYGNSVSLGVDNPYIAPPQPSGSTEALPPPAPEKPPEEPAPVVLPAATKTEKFFLTAADQASGSRNERLNMVIRSKYEAGLLKPYNYVKGYARLSRWMDRKCDNATLVASSELT